MTKLDIDVEAIRREIEAAKLANPTSPRSRALQDLAEVISPRLTIEKLYAFIHVLGTTHAHIRQHMGDITLGEILEYRPQPAARAKAGATKTRHRSRRAEVLRGYEALTAFMNFFFNDTATTEIYTAVLADDPDLTEKMLEAGWGRARQHLQDEGEYRNKRYWYSRSR